MRRNAPLVVVLAALAAAPFAFAGDEEARELLEEAHERWDDPQPAEALRLANEALAANPEKVVRTQIELFIGSVHHVKSGDLDAALKIYDQIIKDNVGATDDALKQLKADAMVRKANILYAEKDAAEEALRLMASAHETWPLAKTADNASQLFFRQGRLRGKGADDEKKALEGALQLSQESITLAPKQFADAKVLGRNLAKFKTQLALVQLALGKADESKATRDSIVKEDLTDFCLYQQAVMDAIEGDGAAAAAKLETFMRKTRPAGDEGIKPRNQLRRFIRTEPDFEAFVKTPGWRTLTEDEPEAAKPDKADASREPFQTWQAEVDAAREQVRASQRACDAALRGIGGDGDSELDDRLLEAFDRPALWLEPADRACRVVSRGCRLLASSRAGALRALSDDLERLGQQMTREERARVARLRAATAALEGWPASPEKAAEGLPLVLELGDALRELAAHHRRLLDELRAIFRNEARVAAIGASAKTLGRWLRDCDRSLKELKATEDPDREGEER